MHFQLKSYREKSTIFSRSKYGMSDAVIYFFVASNAETEWFRVGGHGWQFANLMIACDFQAEYAMWYGMGAHASSMHIGFSQKGGSKPDNELLGQ